jgi:LmbE family N-acetylglucosaminyl deacetylase
MTVVHSVILAALVAVLPLTTGRLEAQQRGTADLAALAKGLTVTPRVLVVGMHPDDEDSQLLAWFARGNQVQTAYLSITRGESAGNFLGPASGPTLGAVRTQETLAARRIDGAEQFFTRMYDFGFAPTDSALFTRWNRDSLVGDIVMAIRSFRPHVVVALTPTDTSDRDAQHLALAAIARAAFEAAGDPKRFPPLSFGDAWGPSKLYHRGPGIAVDASGFNATLGMTYAEIARTARAEHRSQGLRDINAARPPRMELQRILVGHQGKADDEQSVFDGIDTSLARFSEGLPPVSATFLPTIVALGDSARHASVEALARFASTVSDARKVTAHCRHPARVIAPNAPRAFACNQVLLDFDASLDLMLERANAALLAAARVTVEAIADRELLATSDTATVTLRVHNHGHHPVTIGRISSWGDVDTASGAAEVHGGTSVSIPRRVMGLSQRYQWWMGTRANNRYTVPVSSIDGVLREVRVRTDTAAPSPAAMQANGVFSRMMTSGVAIPEGLRRTSDLTVSMTVAGAPVTVSVTPVFRYADAVVGLQERPLAGVPDITINLNRALSFVPVGQKLDRAIHVSIASHTSKWQSLSLRIVTPPGVRDSLSPRGFRLAPRDKRDVEVHIRGTMSPGEKQPFGVIGSVSGQAPFSAGFRTTQYPELLPIRVSWQSGMWLQPVEITVPKGLVVAYVQGVSDDVPLALQDVGVSVVTIPPADLLAWDLKRISTIVFGPRAFEAHPELLQQMPRFMNFARNGGTIVVQRGGLATLQSGALPFFVDLGTPSTQRISDPAAPVARITAAPKVLQWPNLIGANDWKDWVSERAPFAPTRVDPQYEQVIETYDAGGPPNRNAILVARLGKGLFVFSALTLDEQIAAGVPGALRILVNLMSAGLTPPITR